MPTDLRGKYGGRANASWADREFCINYVLTLRLAVEHRSGFSDMLQPMLRIIQDDAQDGATNMARDESLLHAVGKGDQPPTLRLYEWKPATISLGYFQRFRDFQALDPPACDLAVVRRLTGGGAILHDLELTYSLALPLDHEWLTGGAIALYERAHRAAHASVSELGVVPAPCGITDDSGAARGPFFCFARRHRLDLLVGTDKIAGSAQRRTRNAVLQHGSIVVGNRFAQQPTATLPMPPARAIAALRKLFVQNLQNDQHVEFIEAVWTADELQESQRLYFKYAGNEWTRRV